MASRTSPQQTVGWPLIPNPESPHHAPVLDPCMLYTAHETKTALMVIDVILTMLRQGQATGRPPSPADLETAQAALQRASALLEEILAYGGARPLRQAPVDLGELLSSVANMLRVMARGQGSSARSVEIVEQFQSHGCVVLGDRALLEASLINLGFNSLQALGTGGGTIRLQLAAQGAHAEIRIRDTGPGFGDAFLDRRFLPFRTTREGGTGLGLPIARASIQAHKGSLTLQNVKEGGSEALIRLPLLEPAEEP